MRRRALPFRLLVPAALVVLVAVLATLQYHWLGQVSQAERERLQKSLRSQAQDFADAFDAELLWIEMAFQSNGPFPPEHPETFARAFDTWHDKAKYPQIVRAIYLADATGGDRTIQQYHPAERRFAAVAWPEELAEIRSRAVPAPAAPGVRQTDKVVLLRDPIIASVPALLVSLPTMESTELAPARKVVAMRLGEKFLIVHLDRDAIRSSILPALAAEHFATGEADSYRIAIVDVRNRSQVIFARGLPPGASLDPQRSDATVPLFSLRLDLGARVVPRLGVPVAGAAGRTSMVVTTATGLPPPAGGMTRAGTFAIYVESREAKGDVVKMNARTVAGAAWQLVLQHPAGSLDAAVATARWRNLWLSFSILAVLAAGVVLIVINAQRSQRLAAQQMDFVATVSHELRTPLAVIRSAAQNLSAGVVHEADRTRHYGEIIDNEGRRLTDMVEQVLEYAGLSDSRRLGSGRPLDVGNLVNDVVRSWSSRIDARQVDLALDIADGLPPVTADENALGRALDNLLANAMKYGADGRWIGVAVRQTRARGHDEVQVTVSDRGRGIAASDLAHVFEPFYRGRDAVDRQVPGNGLGLSLVKRIAEAHGGRVTVRSSPGQGSAFTIHLPAATCNPAADIAPKLAPPDTLGH
jgi:signal transduction histidine kinase